MIRDKRRIDPETYEVRESRETAAPAGSAPTAEPAPAEQPAATEQNGEVTELKTALAERTADLQRLQAEYVNYKRRVDRDRDLVRAVAVENVFRDLLGVLDDIRSAREHEELTGGFKAVAEEVQRVAGKYGLEAFGSKGDAFDPHIHEALMHVPAQPGVTAEPATGPVCVEILQPGYKIGDRVIRPARVAVADPPDGDAAAEAPGQDQQGQDQQPDA
ncbi:nucleotide exchange factor GrpE [Microlunatus sp. GCM10028923]|uniref:nucleotide exchange factor GrpE n=1 Tax=Microlunatus sp. GCM10028923 TaxID=3273400 RepID=UPI003670B205